MILGVSDFTPSLQKFQISDIITWLEASSM